MADLPPPSPGPSPSPRIPRAMSSPPTSTLAIERVDVSRHQLAISLRVHTLSFRTSLWYADVDFDALAAAHGEGAVEALVFHIAAIEAAKLASLKPAHFDLGPYRHRHTVAFEAMWRAVFDGVWAQWRYEHNLPGYPGPAFTSNPVDAGVQPKRGGEGADHRNGSGCGGGGGGGAAAVPPPAPPPPSSPVATIPPPVMDGVTVAAFCGGGKDSLVTAKLLEGAGVPYASVAYAASVYGRAAPQHALLDKLLDTCAPASRHRLWMHDDVMDAPVVALHPELNVHSITAAETPLSVFAALPLALARGYSLLLLGHEASANVGNLVWAATGEAINHQWGKSAAAEAVLNTYIRKHLLRGVGVSSLLAPIHDPLIFYALNAHPRGLAATHSCNVAKPWCGACPKCVYVWLGYMAFCPPAAVGHVFGGRNLADAPSSVPHLRALCGLTAHTPFECVGQVGEARLALELGVRRGAVGGRALDAIRGELPAWGGGAGAVKGGVGGWGEGGRPFLTVAPAAPSLPRELAARIMPQLHVLASTTAAYVNKVMGEQPERGGGGALGGGEGATSSQGRRVNPLN
ncbi:hypothetical protein I4F81_000093 [Pyropia yezoensis]|uniref:Uncharacterized protein n=1 Tax=Pyropia yezoensis TaxID=2788 RepID=A0ACC3BHW2_PYRYE|nr:hypothetical protein I4F81_000093 [Neopyropia yezoensis]